MKTVITYGTFDLFHQGHYNILKRARALGDYLIVGVTGESYDIERGKLNVRDSLPDRIHNVEETGFADRIIVEEYQGQKINDIIKYNVDILVVGSDWKGKFDYLKEYCDVVYLERTKGVSSTQIRSERGRLYRIGIVTDDISDGSVVMESKFVSGAHVESVCCRDISLARSFAAKYELAESYDDFDEFLDGIDIAYIRVGLKDRARLSLHAIERGRHVICECPVSLDEGEACRLYDCAGRMKTAFVESMTLPYLRAFTQMIWLIHGGIIGDVGRIDIKARCDDMENDIWNRLSPAVHMAHKLLKPSDNPELDFSEVSYEGRNIKYIALKTAGKIVTIELTDTPFRKDCAEIFGSRGSVSVPDDWWNMGFFEIRSDGFESPRRYSFNFEGSGMRYLLHECLLTIDADNSSSCRFTKADSCALVSVLKEVMGEKPQQPDVIYVPGNAAEMTEKLLKGGCYA